MSRQLIIKLHVKVFNIKPNKLTLYNCSTLQFASPQIVNLLIAFVQNDEPAWRGYFYTVLICLVTLTCTIFNSQCFYQEYLVGMRVKTALISAIYRYQNLKSTFFIYPEFWPFLASNYVFSQTKIDLIYVRKSIFLVQNNFDLQKIDNDIYYILI